MTLSPTSDCRFAFGRVALVCKLLFILPFLGRPASYESDILTLGGHRNITYGPSSVVTIYPIQN